MGGAGLGEGAANTVTAGQLVCGWRCLVDGVADVWRGGMPEWLGRSGYFLLFFGRSLTRIVHSGVWGAPEWGGLVVVHGVMPW